MARLVDQLKGKQQVFVREYMISLNASDAMLKAGYTSKNRNVDGPRMLANPRIAAAVAELMAERAEKLGIDADDVLTRIAAIATADRNALTQHRIGACRYCWGTEHHFQWKTPREFSEAVEQHMLKGEAYQANHPAPEMEGGYGYRVTNDPNAHCPECAGLGTSYTVLTDTTKLSTQDRLIFDGVKETRDGIHILMPDRAKALELMGKHLGLFKERIEHTGKDGGPVQTETTTRIVVVPAKVPVEPIVTPLDDNEDIDP
jgi:phage terminase small subunit